MLNVFTPAPQILENVTIGPDVQPMQSAQVTEAIAAAENLIGNAGRLVVRPSGTEPVIRVMAEGDAKLIRRVVDDIKSAIASAA